MPISPTAYTGSTTPSSKSSIGYEVVPDVADTANATSVGHTVTLLVNSDDSEAFLYETVGWAEVVGSNLKRVLPEKSGFDGRMYATEMASVLRTLPTPATNNSVGWPDYDILGYRVTYAIPLYDVLEDDEVTHEHERFCIWRKRVVAANEKIPGGTYKLVNANKTPLNEVGVKTGRTMELTCQWIDVPVFDHATFQTYTHKVNNSTLTLDGVDYPAETVLFLGADEVPRVNASGLRTRDINLTFAIRIDGKSWNLFLDPTATGADKYVKATDTGLSGGNPVYTPAALNNIWTFS